MQREARERPGTLPGKGHSASIDPPGAQETQEEKVTDIQSARSAIPQPELTRAPGGQGHPVTRGTAPRVLGSLVGTPCPGPPPPRLLPHAALSTCMPGLQVLDLSISMVLMITILQVLRRGQMGTGTRYVLGRCLMSK